MKLQINFSNIFILLVVLFVAMYMYQKYVYYNVPSQENFTIPDQSKVQKCLSLPKEKWDHWRKCYDQFGDDVEKWRSCVRDIRTSSDQEKKKCVPDIESMSSHMKPEPSSASGDYQASETMFDLFSQISPKRLTEEEKQEKGKEKKTESFENEAEVKKSVDGYQPLGTLYGTPYSETFESFGNSGHQLARMCMSDPYGFCKKKYGTSAWHGYSQCLLSGEGANPF
jgi:hypothetical protein